MTGRVVHAEWTKLRTVASTGWLAIAIVAGTVALGALVTLSINTEQCPSPAECFEDTTKLSLTGVWIGQAVVAVLAVLAMTNEYGTRLIQATLVASPGRLRVFAAKAAVVTAIVLLAGALGVLGSFLAARNILPSNGFTTANGYPPLSLADEPTLRASVGTVLYLALIALLSLSIGTMLRDTAVSIAAVLSVLYVVPMLTQFVNDPVWSERLRKFSVTDAGLAIQVTRGLDDLPIGPWAGLGVVACYAVAALVAAALLFRLRDA